MFPATIRQAVYSRYATVNGSKRSTSELTAIRVNVSGRVGELRTRCSIGRSTVMVVRSKSAGGNDAS